MGADLSSFDNLEGVAPPIADSLVFSHVEAVLSHEDEVLHALSTYESCEKVCLAAIQEPNAVHSLSAMNTATRSVGTMLRLCQYSSGLSSGVLHILRHLSASLATSATPKKHSVAASLKSLNPLAHLALLKQVTQLLACVVQLDLLKTEKVTISNDLAMYRRIRASVFAPAPAGPPSPSLSANDQIQHEVHAALDRSKQKEVVRDPTINYGEQPAPTQVLRAMNGGTETVQQLRVGTAPLPSVGLGRISCASSSSAAVRSDSDAFDVRGRERSVTLAGFEVPIRLTALCTAPGTLGSICPRGSRRRQKRPGIPASFLNKSGGSPKTLKSPSARFGATTAGHPRRFLKLKTKFSTVSSPRPVQSRKSLFARKLSPSACLFEEHAASDLLEQIKAPGDLSSDAITKLSFFLAHATPVTNDVSCALEALSASDCRIESLLAWICNLLLRTVRAKMDSVRVEQLLVCCQAMTCCVVLVDRLSTRGAFHSSTAIDAGDVVALLKKLVKLKPEAESREKEITQLLDAIRFWTARPGDQKRPAKAATSLRLNIKRFTKR